jgi:hypothetical protein
MDSSPAGRWLRLTVRALQVREVDITVRIACLGVSWLTEPGPTLLAHGASENKNMEKNMEEVQRAAKSERDDF